MWIPCRGSGTHASYVLPKVFPGLVSAWEIGYRLQVDREQGKAASSQLSVNQPIFAKSSFIRLKQMIEMGFHGGPLGGDDAVDACVAQSAVACELMAAQDSVELCAQSFDGASAGVVEEMSTKLDSDALQ